MIFGRHRSNKDIYPTFSDLDVEHPIIICSTPRNATHHFLNLPTEIRQLIFYHYFLSLNLPSKFFHHLTFLGFWGSNPASRAADTTPTHPFGFDLGRRIRWEIQCLYLVNRQVRDEAEEALYNKFVFYVHPRHKTKSQLAALYDRGGNSWKTQLGPQLPPRVRNIQFNISYDRPRIAWREPTSWTGSWEFIRSNFPCLRKVGLAIDCVFDSTDLELKEQLLEVVAHFTRIFRPTCYVYVRFADVMYDRYAYLSPPSPPLCSEMLEEEKLLLRLRDDEKMIWYAVAKHFENPRSELYSVAGLQARYKRLKIRQIQAKTEVEFLQRLEEKLRDEVVENGVSALHTEAKRVHENTS